MNYYRTTADLTCQRCGWLESSHRYAEQAGAKLKGHPSFERPGTWPCPEFVRPTVTRGPGWGPISATGWFVLGYTVFLVALVAFIDWLAS